MALPLGIALLRGLFLDKLPVVSSHGEQGVAVVIGLCTDKLLSIRRSLGWGVGSGFIP